MNEAQERAGEEVASWRGSLWAVGLALAAGLALSWLTAAVSIRWFDAQYPHADNQVRSDQLFSIQAFVAALLAILSTLFLALAHNRDNRRNMDYVGKLFAVGTLGFVALAAQETVDPEISNILMSWLFAGVTVFVFVLLPFRIPMGGRDSAAERAKE
ncbi:hypothetical protein [Curtobacterium flaccumfaciens]|uniref:hypothetical protein n=1 Tax=Curtobacterium flaccumfaciens TaxID=2035 RepID=UPI000FFF63D1|nr:hypothetical protein [Curtobacterium flaccumfaciens]MCS0644966.1 hypothetical protein [Curtobacterium flaccumfaciens pv. flaccumfaciens]MCS6526746.1 hypothetical protein [Curtobacterium flaccumfaciens pv. flaccumfaciens]MCS6530503.1 hypothetical protein [Curtobacterium flaccumfaciens pv. flaccumfaciens]NUU12111.1 hypothetical protein [Curtobacterium flaccumfaciens]